MAMTEKYWEYVEKALDEEKSRKYYQELVDLLKPAKKDKIKIYGKVYEEPRFKRFFSKNDHVYHYSSTENQSHGWPTCIQQLAELAERLIPCDKPFDSALVNYYPDGEHCIGKHNDKDALEGHIASFSFGESRKFRIYNFKGGRAVETMILKDGSMLIMKPGMQKLFKHDIPREEDKEGRINVTLRCHAGDSSEPFKKKAKIETPK